MKDEGKKIISCRTDGLGTRLMSMVFSRFLSDVLQRSLHVMWPQATRRYYTTNLFELHSGGSVFNENKPFKSLETELSEYNLDMIENSDFLSGFLVNQVMSGGFYAIDHQVVKSIMDSASLVYDTNWGVDINAIVPMPISVQLEHARQFWQDINWSHAVNLRNL